MNTTYPMHTEVARLEIDQRLRDADNQRRRHLVRRCDSGRPAPYSLVRRLSRR